MNQRINIIFAAFHEKKVKNQCLFHCFQLNPFYFTKKNWHLAQSAIHTQFQNFTKLSRYHIFQFLLRILIINQADPELMMFRLLSFLRLTNKMTHALSERQKVQDRCHMVKKQQNFGSNKLVSLKILNLANFIDRIKKYSIF